MRLGNRFFVILHYFGYLRRDPDGSGVNSWTEALDRSGVPAQVTEGFITSLEYRQRFRNSARIYTEQRSQGLRRRAQYLTRLLRLCDLCAFA